MTSGFVTARSLKTLVPTRETVLIKSELARLGTPYQSSYRSTDRPSSPLRSPLEEIDRLLVEASPLAVAHLLDVVFELVGQPFERNRSHRKLRPP